MLNDIAHPPRILTNFTQAIQPANFKRDLDSYLKTRAPVTFLSELRGHLQVWNFSSIESLNVYNFLLLHFLACQKFCAIGALIIWECRPWYGYASWYCQTPTWKSLNEVQRYVTQCKGLAAIWSSLKLQKFILSVFSRLTGH